MAHGTGVPTALFTLVHPKVQYALTLQEGDPPEHIERIMRPVWFWFKRAFTQATVIQPISEFLGAWARKMGYKGDIEIVRNGANPESIKPTFEQSEVEALKSRAQEKRWRDLSRKHGASRASERLRYNDSRTSSSTSTHQTTCCRWWS